MIKDITGQGVWLPPRMFAHLGLSEDAQGALLERLQAQLLPEMEKKDVSPLNFKLQRVLQSKATFLLPENLSGSPHETPSTGCSLPAAFWCRQHGTHGFFSGCQNRN